MRVLTLNDILPVAESGQYAIGSFAPRYTAMIRHVLRGAENTASPLIVQISQRELNRYVISPEEFAEEFYRCLRDEEITVPVVLHLDHTKDFSVIEQAISARFTSVMMDASDKPLAENISLTREVVEYAHARGISVEAELGKIGRADGRDGIVGDPEEGYTDPWQARHFVDKTEVDALAVSVGTAHGVYKTQEPKVDYARLQAIRGLTPVPLVLHGGSGVPAEMMRRAFRYGVTKVNIATDLELAMLQALGLEKWMTNAESKKLSADQLAFGGAAVGRTVADKIKNFVMSQGRAVEFEANMSAAAATAQR